MQQIVVSLGDRSYPIYIGSGLLGKPNLVSRFVRGNQVLLVTNDTVAPLYLESVTNMFSSFEIACVTLPDGERYKTLEYLNKIFDELLARNHSRSTTLVALGGGVVGDMTGFAAACYQRGVSFIQIPTTLLSQVDSSVGGKTGVNHVLGKNMIGAFHQPSCVLIDVDTLLTLPDREFRSGIAEVIKYGLILDSDFLSWIEKNLGKILERDPDVLINAIKQSCSCKAKIVSEDERESGRRALLNLGHTFGHAIESWESYKGYLHGEAVAAGTVIAAEFSNRLGILKRDAVDRIKEIFTFCNLPITPPAGMNPEDFIGYMRRDKKSDANKIRLVLLENIGKSFLYDDADESSIRSAVNACLPNANCPADDL